MRFCSPLVFFEKLEENFQIDGIPYQRIDYTCQGGLDKYTLSGVNIMKISYIAPERVYFFGGSQRPRFGYLFTVGGCF